MNDLTDLSRFPQSHLAMTIPPTVHVIDPDDAVRDSLDLLLEGAGFQVACHRTADEFLRVTRGNPQACVVLDAGRSPHDGAAFLEALRQRRISVPVILLADHVSSEERAQVNRMGADLVLAKPVHPAVVLHSVRRCLAQFNAQRTALEASPVGRVLPDALTQRERQVLRMALSGEPNKIIGRKLGISHRTVELHRSNILRKTGTANMLQLASAFGARAWLDDPLTEFGETSSQTMNALRALPS